MNMLLQLVAVSVMNLRNMMNRAGSSSVVLVGIGGVVAVLIAMLSMAAGFEHTMRMQGNEDRVIMLRQGSNSEINGAITFAQAEIIRNKTGFAIEAGETLISGESFVSVSLKKKANGREANVSFRGVSEESFMVRPEVTLTSGRNIEFGRYEVIVGKGVMDQFENVHIGGKLRFRNTDWHIVGVFSAADSLYESEIWTDVLMLNDVFGRGSSFSSLTARLASQEAFERLHTAISEDPRLTVSLSRESEFYAAQSMVTKQLIVGVGTIVSVIMGLGAIFAVLNTMFTAVSMRTTEIATLRALGFGRFSIVFSVMVEALVLAFVGGLVACVGTWVLLDGFTTSTIGANTQVAFAFEVSPHLLATGLTVALSLGLVGALVPAIHAASIPVASALRAQ